MSAPSGIKVPDTIHQSFNNALANPDTVRAIVFTIEGESFKQHATVQPKGSHKDDIALVPATLPNLKTPASFAYRLDSKDAGRYEWLMVTYVPDDAGVRAKMLQASSRSGLMKALGANNFKHDWFATSVNDLTSQGIHSHLVHIASPPPLSAAEKTLAEIREAEAVEAKREALDPEAAARRKKAIVGLGGLMSWGEGVGEALHKVSQRSDQGWIVTLEIPASNTAAISLLRSEACAPSEVASKLPPKSPCYIFYSHPTPATQASPFPAKPSITAASARNTFQGSQGGLRPVNASTAAPSAEDDEKKEGEESDQISVSPAQEVTEEAPSKGRVIFVYCCPSGSPVRYRMVYSTSVRSVRQDAIGKANVDIVSKLETSDPSELTESYLKSSLPSNKPTHSSSLPNPATASSNTTSAPFGGPARAGGNSGHAFGAPAPPGMFGQPRPIRPTGPIRSATTASQIPLPSSNPSTPTVESQDEESQESIRKAFDAFGPRVGAGGGGGFARPRPAGRR
ncbi:hypothetical protein B9479_002721 [Cryptococcus floricola]|uniref:ADF-H domain-containing protein n=1 Tax=Cryptococcus floricola TaxID=2591691 RepID=A0A5D3B267_9TREE|nr:hypothetical protein B9479_002721 [Cryptococcus floricola]